MSRSLRTSALLFALLASVVVAPGIVGARPHAQPTPTPSPTPPPEDTAVTSIARREFVAWQAGIVNPDHYEPAARANLTPEKLAETARGLGSAGSFESSQWIGALVIDGAPPGANGYIYKMHCEARDIYEELIVGPSGKIAGIIFKDNLSDQGPTAGPTPTPFQTP